MIPLLALALFQTPAAPDYTEMRAILRTAELAIPGCEAELAAGAWNGEACIRLLEAHADFGTRYEAMRQWVDAQVDTSDRAALNAYVQDDPDGRAFARFFDDTRERYARVGEAVDVVLYSAERAHSRREGDL